MGAGLFWAGAPGLGFDVPEDWGRAVRVGSGWGGAEVFPVHAGPGCSLLVLRV